MVRSEKYLNYYKDLPSFYSAIEHWWRFNKDKSIFNIGARVHLGLTEEEFLDLMDYAGYCGE